MTMLRLSSVLLLAMLLGLGGCSTTVFETIPTGTTTDCDPAWPGRWQPDATAGKSSDDANKPTDALEISADCRTGTSKGESKPMHLTLIGTKAGQYLQVHNDSEEPDCIGAGKTHCGYVLLRYEREGGSIRLYEADHAKVAAAIAKGSLKGFSERSGGKRDDSNSQKISEPMYRNFLAGDGKQIARLLHQHPGIFVTHPMLVLHRADGIPTPADTAVPAAEAVAPVTGH